jgi:hypothetical protein
MTDDLTSLPVEFLFTMYATLAPPVVVADAPNGTRVVVGVTGGTVVGPRINGTLHATGGDWVTLRKDRTALLDVRIAISTDDGAVICMTYQGILGADRIARVAPMFLAANDRYAWLNEVQAVAIGTPGVNEVTYEVYALR